MPTSGWWSWARQKVPLRDQRRMLLPCPRGKRITRPLPWRAGFLPHSSAPSAARSSGTKVLERGRLDDALEFREEVAMLLGEVSEDAAVVEQLFEVPASSGPSMPARREAR